MTDYDPLFAAQADFLAPLLLALATVLLAGRLLAPICVRLGQPSIIGEMAAGILLGPSLLGYVWPQAMAFLFPPEATAAMAPLAQLGVVAYMFLVGLELDASVLRGRAAAVLVIAHASMIVPFALGVSLALLLYPTLAAGDVALTPFALFLGVSLSVTAFPVLARILEERGMAKSSLGVTALTCAAAGDLTAWCLLAAVVGVVKAEASAALWTVGLTLAYLGFMASIVRPVLTRLSARPGAVALILVALLLSSLATEAIGIHALFGAFLLGALIPHDGELARTLRHKLEAPVTLLLLPAFFALTGLRTQIGMLGGVGEWLVCGFIVVAACVGKIGGTTGAARLCGMTWRDAAGLGVLMNTRGLMELIVLNVGMDLGILSPKLFAMLVLMALVTTATTSPLLSLVRPTLDAPAVRGTNEA